MAVVSLGDCGSGVFTPTGTTFTVPLTASLPRSDPLGGATILLVSFEPNFNNIVHGVSVVDDGATDAFYDTHIFSDGLNHYTQGPGMASSTGALSTSFCWWGLILNPLDSSNSLTITLDAVPDGPILVMVHGYTGVSVDTSVPLNWPGVGTDVEWLFSQGNYGVGATRTPAGLISNDSVGPDPPGSFGGWDLRWELFRGSISFLLPGDVAYTDWEWFIGDLAFYNLYIESASAGRGAWSWTSPDITTVTEFDAVLLGDGITYLYQWVAEQPVVAPVVLQDLSGNMAADPLGEGIDGLFATGAILRAGPGPTWPSAPLGLPVFEHLHRAGD